MTTTTTTTNHHVGRSSDDQIIFFSFYSFFPTFLIITWFLPNLVHLPTPHGVPHPTTHTDTWIHLNASQKVEKSASLRDFHWFCIFFRWRVTCQFLAILVFFGQIWAIVVLFGHPLGAIRVWLHLLPPLEHSQTFGRDSQTIWCNSLAWVRRLVQTPQFSIF